jgi:hypothetical protein
MRIARSLRTVGIGVALFAIGAVAHAVLASRVVQAQTVPAVTATIPPISATKMPALTVSNGRKLCVSMNNVFPANCAETITSVQQSCQVDNSGGVGWPEAVCSIVITSANQTCNVIVSGAANAAAIASRLMSPTQGSDLVTCIGFTITTAAPNTVTKWQTTTNTLLRGTTIPPNVFTY